MNITKLHRNTEDPTGAREFAKISIETKMIVDLARTKSEGDVITYSDLETAIGRPATPGSQGYSYLSSAKRILLRDYAIALDSEPKIGVRVCTNDEKLLISGRDIKRAHRAVRRSRQKLESVEYARLDEPKRKEWNARMSITGALDMMSTQKAVRKIEANISDHQLPSAKTLELFAK